MSREWGEESLVKRKWGPREGREGRVYVRRVWKWKGAQYHGDVWPKKKNDHRAIPSDEDGQGILKHWSACDSIVYGLSGLSELWSPSITPRPSIKMCYNSSPCQRGALLRARGDAGVERVPLLCRDDGSCQGSWVTGKQAMVWTNHEKSDAHNCPDILVSLVDLLPPEGLCLMAVYLTSEGKEM